MRSVAAMPDHANARLIRSMLGALQEGDLARFADAFTPDAVWHVPGVSPLAGDYEGRNGILMLFARIASIAEGSYRFDVLDVMASDHHATHWLRASAARGTRTLEVDETVLSRIVDGRIAEVWQFTDLYAHDGFFRGAPFRRRRRRVHLADDERGAIGVETAPRRALPVDGVAHPATKRSSPERLLAAPARL